jgi:hypothetical protein
VVEHCSLLAAAALAGGADRRRGGGARLRQAGAGIRVGASLADDIPLRPLLSGWCPLSLLDLLFLTNLQICFFAIESISSQPSSLQVSPDHRDVDSVMWGPPLAAIADISFKQINLPVRGFIIFFLFFFYSLKEIKVLVQSWFFFFFFSLSTSGKHLWKPRG